MSGSVRGPQDHVACLWTVPRASEQATRIAAGIRGWVNTCMLSVSATGSPSLSETRCEEDLLNGAHGDRVGISVDKSIQL